MKPFCPIVVAATLMTLPAPMSAQEAFIAQIGGSLQATVTVPAPVRVDIGRTVARLQVGGIAPRAGADTGLNTGQFRLIELTSSGARAEIDSRGDNNSVDIRQNGVHAASISQDGSGLSAAITQQGSGNRASVYQRGQGHSAVVNQTGRGNRAVVVQN